MKKILLIIIMSIFLISIASAEIQTLGVFKQNTNITLIQICGTCTFNTINSVLYPNSSIALSNISMTKDGTFYSFVLNNSFTLTNGDYIVNGFGDLGGTNTSWSYNFEITATGFHLETSDSLIYIVILIATFILFLSFLYPAITLPYSNRINEEGSITKIIKLKYLKLLSIWFSFGFMMWFLQTLNILSTSFIKIDYLSNFITRIFTYTQGLSVGFTFLILTIIIIAIWKDILWNEQIKKHGKAFLDGRLS